MRFDDLAETLRRGGIAPKHVRRYIAELRDHAEDLISAGASPEQALAQLGTEDTLATEMLAREDLKTLGARYPRAFFGAGPAAALLVAYIIALSIFIGFGTIFKTLGADSIEPFRAPVETYCWFVRHAPPILVGLAFIMIGIRQRSLSLWLVCGVVVACLAGASADMSVQWPDHNGVPGELRFGFGVSSPPFPGVGPTLFQGILNVFFLLPALVWLAVLHYRDKSLTQPH